MDKCKSKICFGIRGTRINFIKFELVRVHLINHIVKINFIKDSIIIQISGRSYCQNSNYLYSPAGHAITGNLNVIPDSRVRYIISKSPKYRFPSNIDFPKCRREIAASLQTSVIVGVIEKILNLMPRRNGKLTFIKIIDTRISFTLVIHNFYPLSRNLLFVILNEVTRIFI